MLIADLGEDIAVLCAWCLRLMEVRGAARLGRSTSQTESGVHQVCPETRFSTGMRMLSFLSRYVTDEPDKDCKGIWSDGLITNPLCNE